MIRTTTTKVTFDFSDGNYRAGRLESEVTGGEGHGGLARLSERVTLPIHANILSRPDLPCPGFEDPIAVIHSTPVALEKFCEDVLIQLRP
jgi:hypothetical protein